MGRLLQTGQLHTIVAIPTSEATAAEARSLHIPLVNFDTHPVIDITIDGADEADPNLDVIKGLGGALLREKIVAAVSKRFVIVADHSKRVTQLGSKAPVPVEVIPFAERPVGDYLQSLGARVEKRLDGADKRPYRTDENNIILDCYLGPIADPYQLAAAIRRPPGWLSTGSSSIWPPTSSSPPQTALSMLGNHDRSGRCASVRVAGVQVAGGKFGSGQ